MLKRLAGRGESSWWLDAALVFVLAAALIWPLYKIKYSDKWASIESTFISDARFLRDHWPNPRWQPLWYTGTRFDYIYPPGLRYGPAALMKVYPKLIPPRAYHIYIAVLYTLGIVGVYVLARVGYGSRVWALLAAAGAALLSPGFLFIPEIRIDSLGSWSEPQRLGAMVRYGEGPHISAVAMLGFALAFSMRALRGDGMRWLAWAGVFCALVVSHNFYGATALAMLFPVLLWSLWVTHQDARVIFRAMGIALLSYGLTAFWLVPSYLQVTLDNMRFVSERGNRWSLWVLVVLAIVYVKLTERWAAGRKDRAWPVFLYGALGLLTLNCIGNYYLSFRVIGEPLRMVPEFDLIVILAVLELCRWMWADGRFLRPRRIAVVLLLLACFYPARRYVRHAWEIYVPDAKPEERLEYQITDWLAKNMPDARCYTTGTVRFWFNAWHDLAQIGGGSEQGLLNPVVQPATWHLGVSESGRDGVSWMLALGADAAIVHDKESAEHYHDVSHPKKFEGILPKVYDDGKGNRVYRVPRRYPGLARVVNAARLDALPPSPEDVPQDHLERLVELLERGPDAPTATRWEGTDKLHIQAQVAAGQTLFVQTTYDPAWRAYSAGRRLPIRKSQLNFLRIDAPPGDHRIELIFELPLENWVGRMLTLGSVVITGLLLVRRRR